ncbi:BQ5605_C037g11643 [Microbotryum silenes-dioicae]|uniref:BQ5605_C037g11643 protein n=1 Tax=Microbotryum silenes-dioicae TaxID=796604 RepID=A0A2X0MFG6_9BASI|nr:BQ5605_C037g11643 [Microbotryum silenes-dioicae]
MPPRPKPRGFPNLQARSTLLSGCSYPPTYYLLCLNLLPTRVRWCCNRTISFAQPAGIGPCLRRGLDRAHTSPTISAVRQ